MAVTHDDLAPDPKWQRFFMVFSVVLGLFCLILCLIAEATRSEVNWTATNDEGKGVESECTYTHSGKSPLLTATAALFALAIAMVVHHAYLLVAVINSGSSAEITWDNDSVVARTLTWKAGFFFVSTWMAFAVSETLLHIGLSIESGHLNNWATPQPSCLIVQQGLFTIAGVFGLTTVFLASGQYMTSFIQSSWRVLHDNSFSCLRVPPTYRYLS